MVWNLGKTCYNSFVLYGTDKSSISFVPKVDSTKFSDVTRNGTTTKV